MSRNFLFADFIAHINNSINAKLKFASFEHSKLIARVCKVLLENGYISNFEELTSENGFKKTINIELSYSNSRSVIQELKIISKPSRRVYKKISAIKPFRNGFGLLIMSTSSGILSYRDAIKQKVGGEILCSVF